MISRGQLLALQASKERAELDARTSRRQLVEAVRLLTDIVSEFKDILEVDPRKIGEAERFLKKRKR